MQKGNTPWRVAARKLHAMVPARSPSVGPGELGQSVVNIELFYGMHLPPSYREFLVSHDGWPHVFRGASLLSTAQMLDAATARRAAGALAKLDLPGDATTMAAELEREDDLLPIGLDDTAGVLIAIDPSTERMDGEMDVIVWIAGLGVRLQSFAELLTWLGELVACDSATSSACAA